MSIQQIMASIHSNETLRIHKMTPAHREAEREKIANEVERYLKSGKKITVLTTHTATPVKKAA
jgi:hypothetical protein